MAQKHFSKIGIKMDWVNQSKKLQTSLLLIKDLSCKARVGIWNKLCPRWIRNHSSSPQSHYHDLLAKVNAGDSTSNLVASDMFFWKEPSMSITLRWGKWSLEVVVNPVNSAIISSWRSHFQSDMYKDSRDAGRDWTKGIHGNSPGQFSTSTPRCYSPTSYNGLSVRV